MRKDFFSFYFYTRRNLSVLSQEIIEQAKQSLQFNTNQAKKDLTGKQFHRLLVLGRADDYISPNGKKGSQWWCICDCEEHNIVKVRISNLTSGNTKSCGCLNNERRAEHIAQMGHACAKNLTNQTFEDLLALEPTEERKNGSVVWKCLCSCGKIHYASAHDLLNHRTGSCGHHTESRGIRKIKKILSENNIDFSVEKTFPTCKFTDTKASARFDFFINNEFLLEFDGEQHFKAKDPNFFRDSLEKRQAHDQYKNQWCHDNNIPLKRIPYHELDNITLETIMGDKYLI